MRSMSITTAREIKSLEQSSSWGPRDNCRDKRRHPDLRSPGLWGGAYLGLFPHRVGHGSRQFNHAGLVAF